MPLWGTSADAITNRPKWCPTDENSIHNRGDVFANQSGWVRKAGTAATGNGNTSADPEILVAIGGLAGATASTGLKHPTMTKFRVITKVDHGTSNNIVFDITYDEKVKYTAGSAATLVLTASAGSNVTATLTAIDGTTLADGLTGNVLRFTATSAQADTYTLADDVAMTDPDLSDAISTTNLEAASVTLSSAVKTAIGVTTIVVA